MSILLEQVREAVRTRHYSFPTEEAYLTLTRQHIIFCKKRPLRNSARRSLGLHLAVERKVSASPRTQARSSLLFLYREALALLLGWVDDAQRAKKPKRRPVVFVREAWELSSLPPQLRHPSD